MMLNIKQHKNIKTDKPVGDMVRSLASMSLCKYRFGI